MEETPRSAVHSKAEARASLIALVRALVSDRFGSTLRVHMVRQAAADPRVRVHVEIANTRSEVDTRALGRLAESFQSTVGLEDIVKVRHPVPAVSFKVVFPRVEKVSV